MDLGCVIEDVYAQLAELNGPASTLLVMSARIDDRDQMLRSTLCRGHPRIRVQTVAFSAGGTATMSMVVQSNRGHLNGNANDEFDMVECFARCNVAGSRAQSLCVIVSPLDMTGIMGMMQVLAVRARPVRRVYQGKHNWSMPLLPSQQTQLEQSRAEVATWCLSQPLSWNRYDLPPLAIAVKVRTSSDNQDPITLRLRLVLVRADKLPCARPYPDDLMDIVENNFDQRHLLTLPQQNTADLLLWGYARDHDFRPFVWLCPQMSGDNPFAPVIRHWRKDIIVDSCPLAGCFFFDAWRVHPSMTVPLQQAGQLQPFEGVALPRRCC